MRLSVRFANIMTLTLLSFLLSYAFSVHAEDGGDKVIRFSGQLQESAPERQTLKYLENQFSANKFRIYNPWEKRADDYSGILLADLVAKYATPETKSIRFRAIDDYEITLKKREWNRVRILLAIRTNGQYMSISEKGPLRLVFPDYNASDKEYESNLYKWAWMINRIEFK